MGLRTAFGWLIDRFFEHVFGSPEEDIPTMSRSDAEDLFNDTLAEAALINEEKSTRKSEPVPNPVKGLEAGGPASQCRSDDIAELRKALEKDCNKASGDADKQALVANAKAVFMPALQELVRLGELHPNSIVLLESAGTLSRDAKFKAAELLAGPFGEKLRRALDAGVDPYFILSPMPVTREPAPVGSPTALSRKKIRALPRPRPKEQNPVYVRGSSRPDVTTLDSTPSMIYARWGEIARNAERAGSPSDLLGIAKRERAGVLKSYGEAIANSDRKIAIYAESATDKAIMEAALLERANLVEMYDDALIVLHDRILQLTRRFLPHRDEKGRFIKG